MASPTPSLTNPNPKREDEREAGSNEQTGTPERLIQRLEDATPGLLFFCEADREEALEIAREEMSALAHPQQGGERDGVREALESIKNIGRNARFRAPMSEQDWKNAVVRMEREAEEALASRPVEEQPTAPTSASESSGEEA